MPLESQRLVGGGRNAARRGAPQAQPLHAPPRADGGDAGSPHLAGSSKYSMASMVGLPENSSSSPSTAVTAFSTVFTFRSSKFSAAERPAARPPRRTCRRCPHSWWQLHFGSPLGGSTNSHPQGRRRSGTATHGPGFTSIWIITSGVSGAAEPRPEEQLVGIIRHTPALKGDSPVFGESNRITAFRRISLPWSSAAPARTRTPWPSPGAGRSCRIGSGRAGVSKS